MLIIIPALILVLLIAYFQVVQGLFGSLIMAILSVLCAALALNTYDAVAESFLRANQGPYADATALTVLFVGPLLILRIVLDRLIRGNVPFGPWADRIGGGALGLITGMVLVGMVLIIAQMLPLGETVLGFQPYDASLRRDQTVWVFSPDEFTVGLGRVASNGAFGEEAGFANVHDDPLLEAYCARNTAGKNGSVRADADSASVRAAYAFQPEPAEVPWNAVPKDPRPDNDEPTKIVVLMVSVNATAADADKWLRLPGTHVRLVTEPAGKGKDETIDISAPAAGVKSYYPLGYLTDDGKGQWKLNAAPMNEEGDRALPGDLILEEKATRSRTIPWVYRIAQNRRPDYVVFRETSWAQVRAVKKEPPKAAAPKPPTTQPAAK